MKTIGLIGGMSWESTVTYYEIVNEVVKERLGGLNSAKVLLYSVNFEEIEKRQASGDWDECAEILGEAAKNLEKAGADFIIICTNTMHKVAPQMQKMINIPIVHIAEATADELKKNGIRKVALLGTKYTMTQDFYRGKLVEAGLEVLIPEEDGVAMINEVIFGELCLGVLKEESKNAFVREIEKLSERGAEGVSLGCTEIGLLIKQEDVQIPVFDTTVIHATKAAEMALEG